MVFHQPKNSSGNYNYNAFFYTDKHWPLHFHKNMELIYVLKGTVNCNISGQQYTLNSHEFGLNLPYEIHGYKPAENTEYWVAVFSEDYVYTFYRQIINNRNSSFKFQCPDDIESFLLKNIIFETHPTIYMIKSCLYAVCDNFIQRVSFSNDNNIKIDNMRTIVDFMSENFTKDIQLADLTKVLGYDYSYVSRIFHSIFHMSFQEFLNNYRIDYALRLLEESDEKIMTIAMESGFQSVRSFNNCFYKSLGITPSEYRKKKRI